MNLILDITDGTNGAAVNVNITPFDDHPLRDQLSYSIDLTEGLGTQLAVLDGDHLVEFVFDKDIPASTIDATADALRGLGLANAARSWSAAHRQGNATGLSNVVAFPKRPTI